MNEQHCSEGYLHEGPFALYMWLEVGDYPAKSRYGSIQHRSVLCEKCAERVGAWKIPAQAEIEQAFRPLLDDVKNAIEKGGTQ